MTREELEKRLAGNLLLDARLEADLTQVELSARAGVSQAMISSYVTTGGSPRFPRSADFLPLWGWSHGFGSPPSTFTTRPSRRGGRLARRQSALSGSGRIQTGPGRTAGDTAFEPRMSQVRGGR